MFTGLVEDTGAVTAIVTQGNARRIAIRTAIPLGEVAIGDSIAVDGACLTVEGFDGDRFFAVAGRETLELTTLGGLRVGRAVHLERAAKLGDRLGGHLVQGHVDGVGEVVSRAQVGESHVIWVSVPDPLARYVAAKGSICVDGVSLTVNEVDGRRFRVDVVPHTARVTRLASLRAGAAVNIEVDVIAKYVERLLGGHVAPGLSLETLKTHGFAS